MRDAQHLEKPRHHALRELDRASDRVEARGPDLLSRLEMREIEARGEVARIALDRDARCAGQRHRDLGKRLPCAEVLVEGPARICAAVALGAREVEPLQRERRFARHIVRPTRPACMLPDARAHCAEACVLADAADRRVAVEHLLEQRGSRSRQRTDHHHALDLRREGRDPAAFLLGPRELLVDRAKHALEVEVAVGRGAHLAREVKRAAILACAVEQRHAFETRLAPKRERPAAAEQRLQRRRARKRVVRRDAPRLVQGGAGILPPRARALQELAPLVAAPAVIEDVEEHEKRLVRLRGLRERVRAQAFDRIRIAAVHRVEVGADRVRHRVARRHLERAVERELALDLPAHVQERPRAAEQRDGARRQLREKFVGDAQRARSVARLKQSFDGHRRCLACGHRGSTLPATARDGEAVGRGGRGSRTDLGAAALLRKSLRA